MAVNVEVLRIVIDAVSKGFNETMDRARNSVRRLNESFQRFNNNARRTTSNLRDLTMQLLGVAFFGQQLAQTLFGLFRPAADTLGIFDLWSTLLTVTFLPILQELLPLFLEMFDFFSNLPDPVKKTVGGILLVVAVIAKLLSGLAFLALGFSSLFELSIPALVKSAGSSIVSFFGGITAAGTAVFAALTAIFVGIWLSWEENFNNIQQWAEVVWENLKLVTRSTINLIRGIFSLFFSVLKGDLAGLKIAWSLIWTSIKGIVQGNVNGIMGIMVLLGTGILRLFKGIGTTVVGLFKMLLTKAFEFGKNLINSIAEGIKSIAGTIKIPILSNLIGNIGESPFSVVPNLLGFGGTTNNVGGTSINQTINVTASNRDEVDRLIRENNSRLVEDIRRLTGA